MEQTADYLYNVALVAATFMGFSIVFVTFHEALGGLMSKYDVVLIRNILYWSSPGSTRGGDGHEVEVVRVSSRREAVPFDPRFFEKLEARGETPSAEAICRDIYRRNHWAGPASPSGAGAGPDQTRELGVACRPCCAGSRSRRCST
jgi:hypothetical protein